MKIFVLGSNGMLGTYVHKYFHHSVGVTREQVNALLIRKELFNKQLDRLTIQTDDVVINCIGITNKRTPNVDEFLVVNSLFPRLVADFCETKKAKMIHISTDCVFSGAEGMYCETDPHDDENIYGISKSVGEPTNCCVIRTSIIGENRKNSLDLLEWVRSHNNTTINGWKNHFWNGVTCLQFAKICESIIKDDLFWHGVMHVHSPGQINKADLVEYISNLYELNNTINKIDADIPCDRTLTSIYPNPFSIPTIQEQLIEQKNFKI